ncbi:MAG: hypothetical protein A2452_00800 [Candidatus Firestonebacteria bacterium RIFOXYC2_FULL_39_67]|nr:MAG: hypothetical protein A2536_10760 [Candidatus Firestonebacteria bacterium RIFOXYD2_FULL_39_29]OGF53412.1 MAG: hypothetical protein A2497_03325 [Candidatus Firestonebacteria bacterium RifOxyC12_full_39_7]OGF54738.1 MAG: hypothetical protein A2452_00800 [Candidatus Firestonebacteria bacterium RIFOXYC2_FULL_39_67]
MLSHVPHSINEVHFLVDRLKHGIPVDRNEVQKLLKMVLSDKNNYGIWVKREIDDHLGQDYLSYVVIGCDAKGKLRIIGHRVERKMARKGL